MTLLNLRRTLEAMPAGVDANFAPGKNFLQDSLREAEGLLRRLPRGETLRGQIDALVYDLYLPAPRLRQAGALTPAEIKIVEGAAK